MLTQEASTAGARVARLVRGPLPCPEKPPVGASGMRNLSCQPPYTKRFNKWHFIYSFFCTFLYTIQGHRTTPAKTPSELRKVTLMMQPTSFEPTTLERVFDHNLECVGCGAHLAEPCNPMCPFETGRISTATVLRATTRQLRDHRSGSGYAIVEAFWAAAGALVRREDREAAADSAYQALIELLILEGAAAEPIRINIGYRFAECNSGHAVARALYAAAALCDDITFDADAFGEFTD